MRTLTYDKQDKKNDGTLDLESGKFVYEVGKRYENNEKAAKERTNKRLKQQLDDPWEKGRIQQDDLG